MLGYWLCCCCEEILFFRCCSYSYLWCRSNRCRYWWAERKDSVGEHHSNIHSGSGDGRCFSESLLWSAAYTSPSSAGNRPTTSRSGARWTHKRCWQLLWRHACLCLSCKITNGNSGHLPRPHLWLWCVDHNSSFGGLGTVSPLRFSYCMYVRKRNCIFIRFYVPWLFPGVLLRYWTIG